MRRAATKLRKRATSSPDFDVTPPRATPRSTKRQCTKTPVPLLNLDGNRDSEQQNSDVQLWVNEIAELRKRIRELEARLESELRDHMSAREQVASMKATIEGKDTLIGFLKEQLDSLKPKAASSI